VLKNKFFQPFKIQKLFPNVFRKLPYGTYANSLNKGENKMSKLNGNLSIFNQLKPVSVGFENMFDSFEKMFENDGFESLDNYPYYNIVKTGDYTYDIELALAGFSKKDISIEYADGLLKIKSVKQNKTEEKDDKNQVIHRGISKRYFSKTFTVSDDTEIKGAELKDGLLKISLERIIPESKKPRTIEIN
jgi:molecular chaperone IbpA